MEIGIYIVIILLTFFFQLMKKAFKNKEIANRNAYSPQTNAGSPVNSSRDTDEMGIPKASADQRPSDIRLSFEEEGEYEGESGYEDGYEVERQRQRMRAEEFERRRQQELGHGYLSKGSKKIEKASSWAEALRDKANQQIKKSPRGKSFVKDLLGEIDFFYEDAESANIQPATEVSANQRGDSRRQDGYEKDKAEPFLQASTKTAKGNSLAFAGGFDVDTVANKRKTGVQATPYDAKTPSKSRNSSKQTRKALLQMLKGSQAGKREAILLGELLGPALAVRKTPGGQSIQN